MFRRRYVTKPFRGSGATARLCGRMTEVGHEKAQALLRGLGERDPVLLEPDVQRRTDWLPF
jgi:hypothetical protein